MKKPCHDCAVVCNLYKEFSWALKLEPKDVQIRVSERWFCHNNPRKSCAGNWAEILKWIYGTGWSSKSHWQQQLTDWLVGVRIKTQLVRRTKWKSWRSHFLRKKCLVTIIKIKNQKKISKMLNGWGIISECLGSKKKKSNENVFSAGKNSWRKANIIAYVAAHRVVSWEYKKPAAEPWLRRAVITFLRYLFRF